MRSMRRQLLRWLLSCIAVGSTLIGMLVYWNTTSEVDELYNAHLQQIATLLVHQLNGLDFKKMNRPIAAATHSRSAWKEEDYLIQVWDKNGQLLDAISPLTNISPDAVLLEPKAGFHKRHIGDQAWRIFRADSDNLVVQIAQPESARLGTINEMSLRILLPLVLQVPLLAMLAWFAVQRGLQPLNTLSRDIAKRQPHALAPMDVSALPADLQTLVHALNDLLGRLDQALQQQRNFVADAAHELRTPIAALQLQLDLLKRAQTAAARDIEISALSNGIQRATQLIHQLLQVARSETTQFSGDYRDVALDRIAVASIERHLTMARSCNIDLGVARLDPIGIHCVKVDVEAVLDNLLSNAIRYTPPGGKVDVAIYRDDQYAVIDVTDNGIGIPDAERTRIFDRFHRVLTPHTQNLSIDGSGLGLAIVKSICDRYAATIAVEAGANNKGSCFRVHWPLVADSI